MHSAEQRGQQCFEREHKLDLAPLFGASLEIMAADATKMRDERPFTMTNLKSLEGVQDVVAFIEKKGLLVS